MKIVVTGALGHIGSKVIREMALFDPEAEIVMLDNFLTQRYCSLFNLPVQGRYRFIETDILKTDLKPIIDGANIVLHLAAITDAASSFQNKKEVEHVNFNATAIVAEACQAMKCPMIHISSTSVYGTQSKVVDENCSPDELQPQSPYAETKLKEENYLQALGKSDGLRFVICRFGTICGISPGMRFHTAVNKFCWQAVMGQPLTVWRTALHQKRPYLALDDAVKSIEFIIINNLYDQNIYNVLTENLTVDSIIQTIKKYVPQLDIQYVDSEIMNQLSYDVSNLRFEKQGYKFKSSVKQSIRDTIMLLANAGSKIII